MTIFEANISTILIDFFKTNLENINSIEQVNDLLKEISGINLFFNTAEKFIEFKSKIGEHTPSLEEPNRRAYGDFQTNQNLADKVVQHLNKENILPEFVIEPTCGKGRFIIAALKQFETIKKIVGIEIYYPYVWETKFKILDLILREESTCKPDIEIIHGDIFDFNLEDLAKENKQLNLGGMRKSLFTP